MPSATAAAYLVACLALQPPVLEHWNATQASVQGVPSPWTQLDRALGKTVTVKAAGGLTATGTLLQVDPQSLVLRVVTTERRFDREAIRRVTSKHEDSVKNGVVIGALVGASMAAMSSCRIGDRECGVGGRAAFVGLGAGLWAVIGEAIDRSVDKSVTLYEAPSNAGSSARPKQASCESAAQLGQNIQLPTPRGSAVR
jgi:small nuclear ribonucleoprotein (snRNP)-like protein